MIDVTYLVVIMLVMFCINAIILYRIIFKLKDKVQRNRIEIHNINKTIDDFAKKISKIEFKCRI